MQRSSRLGVRRPPNARAGRLAVHDVPRLAAHASGKRIARAPQACRSYSNHCIGGVFETSARQATVCGASGRSSTENVCEVREEFEYKTIQDRVRLRSIGCDTTTAKSMNVRTTCTDKSHRPSIRRLCTDEVLNQRLRLHELEAPADRTDGTQRHTSRTTCA
jgi:hypothetical protein